METRRYDMLTPAEETRLADLRRKLAARDGKSGFKRNAEAVKAAIAELEKKSQEPT